MQFFPKKLFSFGVGISSEKILFMKKALVIFVALAISALGYSQKESPNSFLGYKLGTKLSDFLSKNADVKSDGSLDVLHTDISIQNMTFYRVKKVTATGKKLIINFGFYKDVLAVMTVDFGDTEYFSVMTDTLEAKYGNSTSYNHIELVDSAKEYLEEEHSSIEIVCWKLTSDILYLLFNQDDSSAKLIFADKLIQDKLIADKKKSK